MRGVRVAGAHLGVDEVGHVLGLHVLAAVHELGAVLLQVLPQHVEALPRPDVPHRARPAVPAADQPPSGLHLKTGTSRYQVLCLPSPQKRVPCDPDS